MCFCTVLCCVHYSRPTFALYCTALYCTVLQLPKLPCTVLLCCSAWQSSTVSQDDGASCNVECCCTAAFILGWYIQGARLDTQAWRAAYIVFLCVWGGLFLALEPVLWCMYARAKGVAQDSAKERATTQQPAKQVAQEDGDRANGPGTEDLA